MGNENTKSSQQGNENFQEALRKQQEMYDRKYQQLLQMQKEEQDRKKNEALEKAIEALQNEKQKYQQKYEELQKQVPPMQQSHDLGQFTNIQERHQNTSAIYPNLEKLNDGTVRQNTTVQPSHMHGSKTVNMEHRFSTTVPTAPPPDFTVNIAVASNSRRDSEDNNNQRRHNEDNNNQFDCRSCNRKLGNQVFQCKNKHNSCFYCRTNQALCGVCLQNITDFRNYALEKRITGHTNQHQVQPCPNSIDGCRLNFKAQDMGSHLKECLFSDIVCPLMYNKLSNCSWRGKINQLRIHFDQDHPEYCHGDVDKEMTLINYKDNSHAVYFVTLGAFKFLVHIKVNSAEKVIMMTAQIFGPQFTAEKWSYQFHVFNKRTPKRKYQYNGVCHSNAIDVNKIFAEANCAIMNSTYANSFADNGQLTYKFYLMKIFNKGVEKNVQASSSKNCI